MAETDGANTSGRRALIVEHDREDAGMLGFHLKRQGLPTMVVSNQNEAWDAMSWGTPDVVVVELGHPDIDALEFAVSLSGKMAALFVIAERPPTADEELTLLRLGVREIFLKPLDHRAVTQKMAGAEIRALPPNSEIHASSIRGSLLDHPVDALLDLARRHSLNARLMIQSPGQGEGSLIIRNGAVIDGVRGETSGRTAVLTTAATMDGRFDMSLLDAEDAALSGEDLVGMDLASLMSAAFEARAPHPKTRRPRARQRPTTIPPGMAKRLIKETDEDDESNQDNEPSTRFAASPWTAVHQKPETGPRTVHSGAPSDMPEVEVPSGGPRPRPRAGHGERRQPESSIVRTEFEDRQPDKRFDVGTGKEELDLDQSDLDFLAGGTSSSPPAQDKDTDTDAKTVHQVAPSSKIVMPESEGGDYLVFESGSSPARTMVQEARARREATAAVTNETAPPSVLEDMGDTDQLMPSLTELDVDSRPVGSGSHQPAEALEPDPDEDLLPSSSMFDDHIDPDEAEAPIQEEEPEREARPRDTPNRPRRESNTLLPSLDDLELPSTRRGEDDQVGETAQNIAIPDDDAPPTRDEGGDQLGATSQNPILLDDDGPPTREEEDVEEPETGPSSPASRPMSRPMSRPLDAPLSRSMEPDDDLGAEFKSGGGKIFRRLLLAVLAVAFVFLAVKFGQRVVDTNPSTSPGAGLVSDEPEGGTTPTAAPTVSDKVAEISGMKDGAPERTYALGVQSIKKKDFADAAKRFRLVLSEIPDHAGAMAGLFQTLMLQGEYEDAGKQLDKLFEAKPDDPKLHFHKALLSQKTGDKVTARTSLNTFLERAPEHAWAPKAKKILSTLGEDQP